MAGDLIALAREVQRSGVGHIWVWSGYLVPKDQLNASPLPSDAEEIRKLSEKKPQDLVDVWWKTAAPNENEAP